MKGIELLNLVQIGMQPIVQFTDSVHEWVEDSVDPNMMAKIIGASKAFDDCVCLRIDLNPFETYNRSVACSDWRDKDGNPTLTWFDTNFYPKDGIDTIYLSLEEDVPLVFVEENSLLNEYVSESSELSYVEWLEKLVMELREAGK